jgi:hypothetical protein
VKRAPSMRSRAETGTRREKCLQLLTGDEAAAVLRELLAVHPHLVPVAFFVSQAKYFTGDSDITRRVPRRHTLASAAVCCRYQKLHRTKKRVDDAPRLRKARLENSECDVVVGSAGARRWRGDAPPATIPTRRLSAVERFSDGAPFVVMMQTAEMRDLNDPTARRRVHSPGGGSILFSER